MKKRFKQKRGKGNFTKNQKGLSPIVTTVLLIALTIGITVIVFLWFRGMVEEGVTKFEKNIELVCDSIVFEASYSDGILSVVNEGDVPIFRVNLKISTGGSYQTVDITDLDGGDSWPSSGLSQGGTFSGDISGDVGDADSITVIPVLIGTSSSGKKTYVCGGEYGKEVSL